MRDGENGSGQNGDLSQTYFEVRASNVHGQGAFALRPIPADTRIIEYTGEAVSPAEADRRYEHRDDPHTFLFTLSKSVILDGGVGGNESRFINHSCDPNCQAVIEDERIFIDALRDISPGEELGFDYRLQLDGRVTQAEREKYACHCGSPNCRGTMLDVPKPRGRKAKSSTVSSRR